MKKKFIFLILVSIIGVSVNAQLKPGVKVKQPLIYTYLGNVKDSVGVNAEDLKQMVKQPLRFVDAKNNEYALSSYMIVYKRLVTSQTEEGEAYMTTTRSGGVFKFTPLPPVWIQTLELDLKKGEELFFTDVIVKAKSGILFYARNLKITVL